MATLEQSGDTPGTPPQEVLPGVFWFTQVHPNIGFEVSSHYLYAERVLIDPMIPGGTITWFDEQEKGPPTDILLSNRHHYRHSSDYVQRYGTAVHCISHGMHEFAGVEGPGRPRPFEFGEELAGGVIAKEVGAICPDDTAFYIPAHRALLCADGVMQFAPGTPLMFVPDQFMDDPLQTKRGLIDSFSKLCELDFEHLLLAHGPPVIGDGKTKLAEFVEAGAGA
jgi:glyoxylase-like metal-dependent hydrolase (beta-lactamase superfamily II)